MRTFRKPTKALWDSVITIGSFDGIHQGHQAVILKTIEIARSRNSAAGIVTFDPLPQQVIHPDFHFILTPLAEKQELLCKLGTDFLYLIEFNKTVQNLEPAPFIQNQILHLLHPSVIVVGYDHQFGKGGKGDLAVLKYLAQEFNFELVVVPEFELDGKPIKSTRIRERLVLGDVKMASRLLNRHYSICGRVGKGLGIGKSLGFPTVNLKLKEKEKLIPADGVYAVLVWYQGKKYQGAMNIGHRPTFDGETKTLETSIININRNLYGARLKIELVARIRPERKFSDPTSLSHQIKKDIERAKEILASPNNS